MANAIAGSAFTKFADDSVKKKKDVFALLKDVVLIYIGYSF